MTIARAAEALRGARRVLVITGAGVSADSGLPTYRGIGGLYGETATEEGISIEEALSGRVFRSRPELTWKYIMQIERACRGAEPNAAHRAIAEMDHRFESVWVLTQNVDGFHKQAGSRNVIDIHGDVHRLLCTRCRYERTVADYADLPPLPTCPECAAVVRPDVVLFGELLPADKLARLEAELARGFDVVFSVGTSSLFPYIAGPVVEASRGGIPTVEINPETTEISGAVDMRIPLRAAEALPAILAAYLH